MSKEKTKNILIIGIGNSGRSDDGLGWFMLDYIEKIFPELDLLYRYQLQIEDAEIISFYSTIIFVDATKEKTENGFFFKPCYPNMGIGLTSHMLEPETVLWLENELYQTQPNTFVLGIEGEKWNLSTEPSQTGLSNLDRARHFFKNQFDMILATDTQVEMEK
ncbi:hypothetical protein [Lutimonas sp.]|uniref:hypothetical protein n=1 Tax=Lutimonas sp. TaxID=1872403 RepID=UPI003D9BCB18